MELIMIMPRIRLITTDPPTNNIDSELLPNHGFSSCEKVIIERALNKPKKAESKQQKNVILVFGELLYWLHYNEIYFI
jgi:hypothetical protein